MVTTRRQHVVCCLYDGFSALDVTLFTTVLSHAGQRWNHRPFEITLGAVGAGNIEGTPHGLVASASLSDLGEAEILFVPGSSSTEGATSDGDFIAQLQRLAARADKVCAAGNAQLLLAQASLLPASAAAADGGLATALEALLGNPVATRDFHSEGRFCVAAHSLGVLPLALDLVRTFLGRSEADAVAAALGQRQRALLLGIKP